MFSTWFSRPRRRPAPPRRLRPRAEVLEGRVVPALYFVNNVSIAEGTGGTTPLLFVVQRQTGVGPTSPIEMVDFFTTASAGPNAATPGVDYTNVGGTLTFNFPGPDSMTVTINIAADAVQEPDETFLFVLTNPQPPGTASLSGPAATVTILNDDTQPGLSIGNASVAEGNAGTTNLVFPVSITGSPSSQVTVNFATSDGTASVVGGDYVAATGTLTFPAGNTANQSITIQVNGDATAEPNETFTIQLSAPVNAVLATSVGTGTIRNDDGPLNTFIVTNTNDSGLGSLRQAVTNAEASLGEDLITFQAGVTGTISLLSALPIVREDVTIRGPGADVVTVTRNTGAIGTFGAFVVENTARALISGLTMSGFNDAGVLNFGTLALDGVVIASNAAVGGVVFPFGSPGGVGNVGNLLIRNSTVANNTTASTLVAAGVDQENGQLIIENSTISGNSTNNTNSAGGVGIYGGVAEIRNSTITNNVANNIAPNASGGGVDAFGTSVSLINTIIAGNTGATNNQGADVAGTFASQGRNLIGRNATATGFIGADLVGSVINPVDPVLGPLQNNGGPTPTHALLAGSPAIDGGNNLPPPATDQRGFPRVTNGTIDIGAFEVSLPSTLAFGAATVSAAENIGQVLLTVVRGGELANPLTVDFATADGTAIAGTDYTAATGTLTFAPNATQATITINLLNETLFEADETFTVSLSNFAPTVLGNLIAPSVATVTVTNDDAAPTATINAPSVVEGNASTTLLNFVVTLSAVSGLPANGTASTVDGTAIAPGDYVALLGTLFNIPAGQLSTTVAVTINGDTLNEPNETLTLNVTLSGGATGTASGIGTILNDDAPAVSINNVAISEGNAGTTNLVFTLTLSAPAGAAATVNFATANGTATAPTDFTAATGTATIPSGQTSANVTVAVNGDTTFEPDETLTVTLSNPVNALLASGAFVGTGTILNDDTAPTLSINNPTVTEGDAGTSNVVFTVSLSAPSGLNVTVNFATVNGTATAPADFVAATGQLTIPAGATTGAITVAGVGDTVQEATETFTVALSNSVGATLPGLGVTGTATIIDNDAPAGQIQFGAAQATVDENGAGGVLNVVIVRTGSTAGPASVTLVANSGTALAGLDFATLNQTVNLQPNEAMRTVALSIANDVLFEEDESFTLTLTAPTGATLGGVSSQAVTLRDDDANVVDRIYRETLDRPADPMGRSFWIRSLAAGFTTQNMARVFLATDEARAVTVRNLFRATLGRTPNAFETSAFVAAIGQGVLEADLAVSLVVSAEFTARHPTAPEYVAGVIRSFYNREATAAEINAGAGLITSGFRSRSTYAYQVLSMPEAFAIAVDDYFRTYLGRNPDPAGAQAVAEALAFGLFSPAEIAASFLGSEEFLARARVLGR